MDATYLRNGQISF